MKRKMSPLVRIRYEAVHPNPDREDKNTVQSTSPFQHSSGSADVPRAPGPDARAAVAHRKDAPAIRHSSRGLKRLGLEAAGTEDSKETALEYFRQVMHAQSSGGTASIPVEDLDCPSQCVVRTRRRR